MTDDERRFVDEIKKKVEEAKKFFCQNAIKREEECMAHNHLESECIGLKEFLDRQQNEGN